MAAATDLVGDREPSCSSVAGREYYRASWWPEGLCEKQIATTSLMEFCGQPKFTVARREDAAGMKRTAKESPPAQGSRRRVEVS